MVRLWQQDRAVTIWLGFTGLLAFPVASALLGWLYVVTHPTPGPLVFSGEAGVLTVVLISLGLCGLTGIAHEMTHAFAMWTVGHKVTVHFDAGPYPRLTLDRDSAPFARAAFVWVKLAPVVILTAVFITRIMYGSFAGWWIVPAAFQLTASKMDIVYSLVALRQPAGTLFRVTEAGLELTEPVDTLVP